MRIHEARLRVRYAETDQMGVVYYSNYLVWMEVGRVEYCRAAGFDYRQMEQNDGVLLAVVEAHCRYLYPARYDQEIAVLTRVEEATTRMARFGYEMKDAANGRSLAAGYTRHLFCTRDMKPARLPQKYRELLGVASPGRPA